VTNAPGIASFFLIILKDHAFRQSLSPIGVEASAIVSHIRDEEQRTVWTSKFEDSLAENGEGNIYPGMMFTLAKSLMEKTKLWRIVRRMPKGALLHAHLDAMADLDFVFAKALSTSGMHIYSSEALFTPSALQKSPVFFQFSRSTPQNTVSIWSPEYQPSTLVPLSAAADDFPNGGRDGFLLWIKDRCSITARESLDHNHGPNAVWQKFKSTFGILGSIIYYEPIFRAFVREMCRQLLDDGIRWVDVRAAFNFQYRREGSETAEGDYEEMVRVFGEEVGIFKASPEGKNFWGARIIWTSLRNLERREIVESMQSLIHRFGEHHQSASREQN
jgi:adenosine deaminase CECR1